MIEYILKQIDNEIELLNNENEKKESIIEFYNEAKETIEKNNENTKRLSPSDYILIYLTQDKTEKMDKIKEELEILKPLFDKINKEDIDTLVMVLENIRNNRINKFNNKILEQVFGKYINNSENIEVAINKLLEYLEKYQVKLIRSIVLFCFFKTPQNENTTHPINILFYNQEINNYKKTVNQVIKGENYRIKETKKQISRYKDSKKIIERYKEQEDIIDDYKPLLNAIKNNDIKRNLLLFIDKHNRNIYIKEDLDKKIMMEKEDFKYNYIEILSRYDIQEDEIDLEKIMKLPLEGVEQILNQLSNYFNNKEIIIKCIQNTSSIYIFNIILNLIKKGIIHKQTLINYPKILNENSEEYISLLNSINFLCSEKINPMIFYNSNEVIINNDYFEINIKILKEYDLINYIPKEGNLNYLKSPNLAEKIDYALEIGLENELEKNQEILNNENIKRLYVLRSIGILPENIKELYEIIEKKKYKFLDDELDQYIINDVPDYQKDCKKGNNYEEIPELLEYEESNSRVYIIDGLLFSKNRVKRYYDRNSEDKKEALFQAIIHNTILEEKDIKEIKNIIYEKVKRK